MSAKWLYIALSVSIVFSGTMSTATSPQPPKDDEEEEDEEQGEEFEFDDSTDEEKTQEEREGLHGRMLTVSERPEPLDVVPPAGQEGTAPVPTTGKNTFFTVPIFFSSCVTSIVVALFVLMFS